MTGSADMDVVKATTSYEVWLADQIAIVEPDLELKHHLMAEAAFSFMRATFYRWAQLWPTVCSEFHAAPKVLAVGDLHVENFGTWRDAEGRLVWGINDFDEAWTLPYTNDLVRLAASIYLAIAEERLALAKERAAEAILKGYQAALNTGGGPLVFAEGHTALRKMAEHRLHNAERFWEKLERIPSLNRNLPRGAAKALVRSLPERDLPCRFIHRVAGMGSLGRQRFVALADWRGAKIAREAKAIAPSACWWAIADKSPAKVYYQEVLDRAVRCPDPFLGIRRRWIVRRLAPDCARIELASLPRKRDEVSLLQAMGWETANVHLGSIKARTIRADLKTRRRTWLHEAAERMTEALRQDWEIWRKASKHKS